MHSAVEILSTRGAALPKDRKRLIRFVVTLAAGVAAGALGAAVVVSQSRGVGVLQERLAALADQQAVSVATLSNENQALVDINDRLEDRVANLEYLVGDASVRLQARQPMTPARDFDRFLRAHPEAAKYLPYLNDAVTRYADIWPVDPVFALAILKQESNFGEHLVSRAGALGDAQFIASTWRRYGPPANEPWTWKSGRRNFGVAAKLRREAREARRDFLDDMEQAVRLDASARENRAQLRAHFETNLDNLRIYYERMAQAGALDREGNAAYGEYRQEIEMAMAHARSLEQKVRERQRREESLIRTSNIRALKSREEKETEVRLIVNDYLATVDPRLSPMLLSDALVHHLADLFKEFNGDRRLVASRYNASRRAMEAAVASLGGGVGIPLLDETQNYVNRVVAYHAFFTMDAGVLDHEPFILPLYASR